jgi:hypothetical protein
MTKPLTTIVNAETGETETREMNELEFADYQALQTELADEATAKAKADTDKAALLAKLGITADEAKLLLS